MTAQEHAMKNRAAAQQRSSIAPGRPGLLQRKCACGSSAGLTGECEECNKKRLMRRPDISRHGGVRESQSGTHILDPMPRSSGAPLDAATRAFFEPRFGHDFSRVRVHTDERAAQSARAVNALAYTVGDDVVFAAGRYALETQAGRRLLAHELVHTIQQAPQIARQEGIIPAPPLDLGPGLARARQHQPRLRPHVPLAPTIAAPPIPVESTAPMPAKCPNTAAATAALGSSDVASVTETEMARDINLAQARAAGHTTAMSASILQRADTAIRAEFGSLLPSGRNLRAPGTVTQETPTQFAQTRVPDAATARERIAQAALEERGDFLRGLCITDSSDATLQTVVGGAVLKSRGLSFVRDYQAARIGGQTNFPTVKGKVSPHVTIPSESRNMGHIVVHEAMHYYVNDRYRTTAENDPAREKSLMEGGAEFLARHVINQRLSRLPEFALHTGTYATEFHYVADNLMKAGGIDAFKLAYFQGRIDLLGLPAQPKLAISEPGDALEREADAVADEVLRMDAAETPAPTPRVCKAIPPAGSAVLNFDGEPRDRSTASSPNVLAEAPISKTSPSFVQCKENPWRPHMRCGEDWACATPARCKLPDKGLTKSNQPSTSWTLKVMIDIEAPSAKAVNLLKANVGHTYVEFSESNGDVYTYGFYPHPSGRISRRTPEVDGCVVHPDTAHRKCTDYQQTFSLTHSEYTDSLSAAHFACENTPKYNVYNYNCTTFASALAFLADQSLPAMHGRIGHGLLHAEADNPNTLYENLIKRDAASEEGTGP